MTEPREEQGRKQELPAVSHDDIWADEGDEAEAAREVQNDCRCGECCKLLIEVDLEDAKREPMIAQRGSPIYAPPELTRSGREELIGYLLNDRENGYACTFLDTSTKLCSIYDKRPWACRVFDCDGQQREELVQLGILPPRDRGEGRGR